MGLVYFLILFYLMGVLQGGGVLGLYNLQGEVVGAGWVNKLAF